MSSKNKNKRAASSIQAEEDADNLQLITTPTPKPKRRVPPQDIGIAKLVLGSNGVSDLVTRSLNPHFNQGFTMETLQLACDHISANDPLLSPIIAQFGPPERLLAKGGGAEHSSFASLSKSIVFQQLATQAAAKIYERVLIACDCVEAGILNPTAVANTEIEALCSAGLSGRKASYVHDLARHYNEGLLSDELIDGMTIEELHKNLTAVKGIGPWSCDMFALFHLGLTDVLPVGDLGVRKGMEHLYGLSSLPSPAEMEKVAERWAPYRSVGSYFMWQVEYPRGDGKKKNRS